jgi:hypothetical protein
MTDDREPLGRLFHERGRLTVNAELPERQRRGIGPWEERDPMQQEIDMRGASAVAARAVHDAGLENTRRAAQLFALAVHLPAILDALRIAVASGGYEYDRKRYEAALVALGGGEGQERSDEKEAGHGHLPA